MPNVVESVSGSVDGSNNLTITVNGISSGGIPLGDLSTMGYDLTVTVTASDDTSVEGVTVQAVDGENAFTGVTDSAGIAHIIITENGDYVISAVEVVNTTTATQEVGLSGNVTLSISNTIAITGTITIDLRDVAGRINLGTFTNMSSSSHTVLQKGAQTTITANLSISSTINYDVTGIRMRCYGYNISERDSLDCTYMGHDDGTFTPDEEYDDIITVTGDIANYDFTIRVSVSAAHFITVSDATNGIVNLTATYKNGSITDISWVTYNIRCYLRSTSLTQIPLEAYSITGATLLSLTPT